MLGGLRILAVEDDDPTAELVRAVLEGDGHEVRIASDGRKALAELAGWRPDIVILDLLLPALSGHALLRYLRDLPEYRQVPVLVMSAALPTLQEVDGATAVLAKPFELPELLTLIAGLRATLAMRAVTAGVRN
ncbi:MAG: response regulator [Candidatus Limnocylindria bacterium]